MNIHAPTITAHPSAGQVVIRGKKPGFTSVTIQMRVDSGAWADIGTKIGHFPFYDTTEPKTAGATSEKREYRGLGYDGDTQVGQPSTIATAVFTS